MYLITDLTAKPHHTMKTYDTKDGRDIIIGITGSQAVGDSALMIMDNMNRGCTYTFSQYFQIRCVDDRTEILSIEEISAEIRTEILTEVTAFYEDAKKTSDSNEANCCRARADTLEWVLARLNGERASRSWGHY